MKINIPLYTLISICALSISLPVNAKQMVVTKPVPVATQAINTQLNWYQVTPKLFRSEQLTAKDIPALQKLGIRTVINLRYFDRDDDVENLHGLQAAFINQPLKSWRIKPEEIAAVLHSIESQSAKGGVLVHCYHGADRTGLVIAMHRIVVQGWDIPRAKAEMMNGPYGFHTVWRNIPKMLNQETVAQVRRELQRLQAAAKV